MPGLEFIKALRPVTYHFSVAKEEELLGVKAKINHSKGISDATVNGNVNTAPNTSVKEIAPPQNKYDIEKVRFTGLVAQEVDAAAKKLNYDFSGVDKTGKIWGLRYGDFIAPLVKAVQELSQQNDDLKKLNGDLKLRLDKIEAALALQTQNVELGKNAKLEQNVPNPYSSTTIISYYLPANIHSAYINFYASNGAFLKSVKLSGNGNGTINVKATELPSGACRYSLVVDGKVVDSNQMVQAK